MKKFKAVLFIILTTTLISVQQASAENPSNLQPVHKQAVKHNDEVRKQIEKFRSDNVDLRKQITMKRAEEKALIKSEAANIEAVRQAAGELFDLRATLADRAKSAGIFLLLHKDVSNKAEFAKSSELRIKIEKFLADTKDLRRQMAQEKAARQALMYSKTPDPSAVAKVTGTIFDLKNSLHQKAVAYGLPQRFKGWHNHHA